MSADTRSGPSPELGPRAITYPYRRIERVEPTPSDGPDPYGDPDPAWMRIDWSEHLSWIEAGGTRVVCAEIGEGPPDTAVLLVHGLGGCWQNWLENLPALAELGHRAIAIDLPGFGSSPMPPWEVSIPGYGRFLGELAGRLGIERCTLVGNSMGGFISAEAAIQPPEWVERLVLVSSAGISHATMRREPAIAGARAVVAANPLMRALDVPAMRRPGLRKLAFNGILHHPERLRPELLTELMGPSIGAPAYLPSVAALVGYDLLDRLEEIRVPTLVVWGRDDLFVPVSDAAGFVERIPRAELVVFDDCGHMPMAERPVRFNRLIERFAREPVTPVSRASA